jgi:hypothetical protein
MRISVLLPTRGRTEALMRSIDSLLTRAAEPDQIEILLGMDTDDTESVEYVQEHILPKYPNNIHIYMFKKLGYGRLNVYINTLCALSWGYWLMMWNDDAVMNTDGWDLIIDQYQSHPMPLLRMPSENFDHPFALFPIIKKEWFDVVGTFSYQVHNDRFVYNVASNLCGDILVNIPVNVIHDRADITGNNNDDTFKTALSTYGDEGDPTCPLNDDYPVNFEVVIHTVNKLRKHINKNYGYNMPLIDQNQPMGIRHIKAQSHKHENLRG